MFYNGEISVISYNGYFVLSYRNYLEIKGVKIGEERFGINRVTRVGNTSKL